MRKNASLSLLTYYLCCVFLLGSTFLVNKFNEQNSRTIISWDIAGYYLYLPAFFYDDPGKLNNLESIKEKYSPFGDGFYQALKQPNGNYVIKYPYGQALMFLPAFTVGHLWAKLGGYPVDGFSLPYQVSFTMGCVIFAFVGLWFIRKALLKCFSDKIVAASLFVLCFASNYYNYVSFSGGLPHSNLFTIYALIIYLTILFYEKPSFAIASALGLLSGLAVATRPTEIVCVFIPVFWRVSDWNSLKNRANLFLEQYGKIIVYGACAFLVCSVQLLYWKKYSGHFIHWSYGEDEKFNFFHPHFIAGFFSYKKGWFTYTPIMILSLPGFIPLFKKSKNIFWTAAIFTVVNLYFVFAWSRWWYGGSFSQRAVIESYAVLLFPLAAFFTWAFSKKISTIALGLFILFCVWFNLLMTYQANCENTVMESNNMTKEYYWRIFGKTKVNAEDKKLLDTDEEMPKNLESRLQMVDAIDFENSFYNDTTFAYSGKRAIALRPEIQRITIPVKVKSNNKGYWYRAYVHVFSKDMEWSSDKQAQFGLALKKGGEEIKSKAIHLQRIADVNRWQEVFVDIYAPVPMEYDTVEAFFQNWGSPTVIYLDDLRIMRAMPN